MSVIGFLKHFGLDKDFKLNIEPNHTTLAGHSYEHDIIMASVYDALDHSVPFVKRFDAVCWFMPLCVFVCGVGLACWALWTPTQALLTWAGTRISSPWTSEIRPW